MLTSFLTSDLLEVVPLVPVDLRGAAAHLHREEKVIPLPVGSQLLLTAAAAAAAAAAASAAASGRHRCLCGGRRGGGGGGEGGGCLGELLLLLLGGGGARRAREQQRARLGCRGLQAGHLGLQVGHLGLQPGGMGLQPRPAHLVRSEEQQAGRGAYLVDFARGDEALYALQQRTGAPPHA